MRLRDAGIAATVYESSARIGGRMHSERSYWDAGQHTEWCGAMVDSTHVNIHRLAHRFHQGCSTRTPDARRERGIRAFSTAATTRWPRPTETSPDLSDSASSTGKVAANTTYANATPTARRLDAMSMRDWIARYVPRGLESQLGRLIAESYRNEYGREIGELSALNLVMQLGQQRHYAQNHEMNVLGYSDQHYILANGSQSLPEAIAAWLPAGSVLLERRLLAIRLRPGGSYELRFDHRGARETIYADRVILALPFIALRAVDYAGAGFDSAKANAIENLGYGYHTKLHLQFDRRAWMRADHPWPEPTTGQIWTTLDVQSALDFSLGQRGEQGLIEVFTAADPAMIDTPPMPYARVDDSAAVELARAAFLRPARSDLAGRRSYLERQSDVRQRSGRSEYFGELLVLARRAVHDDRRARSARARPRALRRRAYVGRVSGLHGGRRRVGVPRRRRDSCGLPNSFTTRPVNPACTSSEPRGTSTTENRRSSTALTGTNPDRWDRRAARGMTLDLGFAHLRFEDGIEGGIVDVPGHERFLHNMLAGAAGMELLLLVVDANEGVMPQTLEHLRFFSFSTCGA